MKIIKLWLLYTKTSIIREMEFRTQFIGQTVLGIFWIALMFIMAEVFFLHTNEIAGWGKDEIYVLIITWGLMHELFNALFVNGLTRLTALITDGKFDHILIKPVHPIWQLAFSRFSINPMSQVVIQAVLLIFFLGRVDATGLSVLILIFLFLCGLVIQFSLCLLLQSLAFWFIKIENIHFLFWSLTEIGRYPSVIFKSAQVIFYTMIPVVYLGNVQTMFLVGTGSLKLLLITIFATILSAIVAWAFFSIGSKRYASASS